MKKPEIISKPSQKCYPRWVKKIPSNRLLGRKRPSLRRFDWPSANRDFLGRTRGQAPKISYFKGQVPEGYELGKPHKTTTQPCQQDGLTFDFAKGQQVQGHHFNVLVGTARNTTEKPLTFHEHNCHSQNVAAVSMWPKNTLYPGQRRELFVLLNASEPESAPVIRPSLLSY